MAMSHPFTMVPIALLKRVKITLSKGQPYSAHKKRHLIKISSVLLSDGHVVDTIGPFAAAANDALITESILELNNTPSAVNKRWNHSSTSGHKF